MKKHIPNFFTLMNVLSGCIGVVFAFNFDLSLVCVMILFSLILDYLDGMAARALNVRSELGKELDSLADMISFGLLPGILAFKLLEENGMGYWSYLGFLIPIQSAYRLARFNIDTRQSVNFIGLPTPANAIFWASFPLIIFKEPSGIFALHLSDIMANSITIITCIAITSFLLNAEIALFSLKLKNFNWKSNQARFIFLLASLILFLFFSIYSIPFIIVLYILISIIYHKHIKTYEIQS